MTKKICFFLLLITLMSCEKNIDFVTNKTEDILGGKQNPAIIAKAEKRNGLYSIPELGLI